MSVEYIRVIGEGDLTIDKEYDELFISLGSDHKIDVIIDAKINRLTIQGDPAKNHTVIINGDLIKELETNINVIIESKEEPLFDYINFNIRLFGGYYPLKHAVVISEEYKDRYNYDYLDSFPNVSHLIMDFIPDIKYPKINIITIKKELPVDELLQLDPNCIMICESVYMDIHKFGGHLIFSSYNHAIMNFKHYPRAKTISYIKGENRKYIKGAYDDLPIKSYKKSARSS